MKLIKKIIEYGLYLLVFVLPWQTRWIIRSGEINDGYSEYLTISLYGTDILLFIVILLNCYVVIKRNYSKHQTISNIPASLVSIRRSWSTGRQYPITWLFIVILELFAFISIFFADDKILALYRYGVLLLGIGLFWLIVSASYKKIKLLWALLAGIFLQACLGFWQFLTQSTFQLKWLGMAEHNPVNLGVSVIETIGSGGIGERWLRAYGGLDHPNILGGVLVVGILLAVGLLFKYNDFENNKLVISNLKLGKYIKKIFKHSSQITNYQLPITKILLLTSYFLLLISLFFTFSRGAWTVLIVGIIMMLLFAIFKKDLVKQKEILKIILFSSILIFIFASQFSALVKTRLSNNTRLEVKSNIERVESLAIAKNLIKKNWLLGTGIGNYTAAFSKLKPGQLNWYYQPVHNVFLLVWVEIGLLGLLGFLGLLGYLGWLGFKNKPYMSLPILSALVIIMLVDHWLWSLHFGVLFFWLVAGLIIKEESSNKI